MDSGPLDPDPNSIPKINASQKQKENQRTAQNNKKGNLNIATWNIRRGLLSKENELVNLLQSEELDVIVLTETDTKKINAQDYKISGYTTHVQSVEGDEDMVRVMALTKDNCGVDFELRTHLMSALFPSIWIEIKEKNGSKTLLGGFYRQWSMEGKLTVPEQVNQMELFSQQIREAANSQEKIIITGDANLCADSWLRENYDRKSVAQPLQDCLLRNGLEIQNVGFTFQADHMQTSGMVSQSALDHVYNSVIIKDRITVNKLQNSSSDHLPVKIKYNMDTKKTSHKKSITKRSFKNFTKERWNEALEEEDWLDVEECEEVDEMVSIFTKNVTRALDKVAPVKKFTIISNYRFGLSEETKELMKKRDRTRKAVQGATGDEKKVLLQQYKTLRNNVTGKIRKENIDYNNNRIEEAKNERELWSVANEVINPRKESDWSVVDEKGETIKDEKEVAEMFNGFFIKKVEDLKGNINPRHVEDPLARLSDKLKNLNSKLEFKTVTQRQMKTHLKKLSKKKSSGLDGLSQENLILGIPNLLAPLTAIVNQSITQGTFPSSWKEAAVTPVLKKGSPQILNNYRPVSCLPAASKVLEIVVCSQLSDYLESNGLLPGNQHGFRPRRSTMTAWQEIQLDWAIAAEQKLVTGVLLWDLSAAFDTLDCDGLCRKLALFGVQQRSVNWVKSFLTNRTQRVKIGKELSEPRAVNTGVPQGGVLSPLIFVLFVSDLQDWLSHSTAPTYADDTHTGTTGKTLTETLEKMEEDAQKVLNFMASNGLVANAKKTSFLILNCRQVERDLSIKIGTDEITRETSAKLLGITFQDDQQWRTQIRGKGGLISSLNSRIYIIRRLKNYLSFKSILKMVDGIFTSKLRYGLQLMGKVRTSIEDQETAEFKAIQVVQNNLLRLLNGTKTKDMVSIPVMLKKFNMLSANQLNASMKLLEVWKAINLPDYPLKINRQEIHTTGINTRADKVNRPIEVGKTNLCQKTCVSDAIRLWNKAPGSVTESASLHQVKNQIRMYVKSLPT